MSPVAQCLRGSGPVPRSKIRFRLKARENKVRRSRGVVRCNCAVRQTTRGAKGRMEDPATTGAHAPLPCMPALCPRTIGVPALPACDQGPGWRRAARLQEDEAKATGPFPAEGRHPFSAARHRVTVRAQDFPDMPCGPLHPWVESQGAEGANVFTNSHPSICHPPSHLIKMGVGGKGPPIHPKSHRDHSDAAYEHL
ncbi:hypothetical protein HaLaN_17099 [Haematococcus lacustris]|uniref:Uncharacterized protein n=1 Tax=Haematococcus lacustris TaxID=44745 RepID=A0A699ZMQ6_HAELA|nr:hypothetical protein HaLaN_17099 [Haematococcus lacustris]